MGFMIIYFVTTTVAVLAVFSAMGVSASSGHFMESGLATEEEERALSRA